MQVHVIVVSRTGLVAAHEPSCSLQAHLRYMNIFADYQLEILPGAGAVGWPGLAWLWPSQQIPALMVWCY